MVTPAVPVEVGEGLSGFLPAKGNDLAQKLLKKYPFCKKIALHAQRYM
ncbi:hypothetical protein EPIR_1475 [Erwinia piriflorinigrans CFBP 5888]|uniref:Uncharacterized protein n=1 Tax=Erwinia piriflorinigrans CFBP 5888 TaxID=1161919 RepID=V5Z736_9GAMM|nr:hypothetical protein EPIR_1475 [Erwinia piriflorinigrans CFBP 5888]